MYDFNMLDKLIPALRTCVDKDKDCLECQYNERCMNSTSGELIVMVDAADAIEELLKAAKAMHTWIFLNSGDEQAAYDECGLTAEMNAALGYGGQYIKTTACLYPPTIRVTSMPQQNTGEAEWRYQTMSVPGGKGQTYAKWSCSVCKGKQKMRSRYCPYCGKKMKNGWQKE